MTGTPQTDTQIAHRFRFAADILEGMTDGIDGERLGALVRWALHGRPGHDEREALIRIFEAPHLAAIDEGAWEGDSRVEAEADLARVTAEADRLEASVCIDCLGNGGDAGSRFNDCPTCGKARPHG